MSRQDSVAIEHGVTPTGRLWLRRLSVTAGLVLLTGVAACGGDDDDAASSTDAPATSQDVATTTPTEITQPSDSAATPGSDASPDTGATDDTAATEDSAPTGAPESTTEGGTTPSGEAATEGSETQDGPAEAADAAGTSDATGDTSDGTTPDAGPTTTGAPCEFAENTSLPLERCNMGPAVAVVQSILQANGYDVGIDGEFGDQTFYAVRAFQEDEGLQVDGIVGLQTWTALDVSDYGTDANGDGVIAPDEIDLAE